ncbi:hypothetical protein VNO78_21112 [Psophocarpus tetragonolobus]|uniref:Late embryogenesis abundant protein LEA-2 subgroup domain-containing protein n=1 Tax=Psophocarpus tetragonolobus TaxID=3891 RepID=A0AAN9SAI2_PSOTE
MNSHFTLHVLPNPHTLFLHYIDTTPHHTYTVLNTQQKQKETSLKNPHFLSPLHLTKSLFPKPQRSQISNRITMSQLNGAYYGPSIPPPRNSYQRPSRGGCGCLSCCCGCIFNCIISLICKLLVTVLIIVAIVALLFWFIVRPNVVKYYVNDATLTQFSYDTYETLHYDLALNVSIRNPNRRVGIYYDQVQALGLYQDLQFGNQTLGPFFQHTKNTTFLTPLFKGQHLTPLSSDQVSVFDKDKGSGVYPIDFKLFLTVRFKFLFFKSPSVNPRIRCELHVPLKSRNSTASPNAAFQTVECDWDYKKWWIR